VVRLTGDPVTLLAEPGARAEDLARVRTEWGLDRSWPVQYLAFAKNVFTGELGKSFNYQMSVSTLYFQRLPNSLELALAATLISFVIVIPAGLISAVKVNSGWDNLGKVVALLGLAIPGFWLGLVMILVFSVWLEWLPTSGQGDWRNLIMPAVALGWCSDQRRWGHRACTASRRDPSIGRSADKRSHRLRSLPPSPCTFSFGAGDRRCTRPAQACDRTRSVLRLRSRRSSVLPYATPP